jgi:hypothetical protein
VLLSPSIALVGSERGEGRGLDRGLHLLVLVKSITQEVLVHGYGLQTIERSFGGSTADRPGGAGQREP